MAAGSKPVWRPWESQEPAMAPRPQHICKICHVSFRRFGELKRHCDSCHFKRVRHCHICMKTFTRKDNLTRHLKNKHISNIKSCCRYCHKVLSRKDAAARHQKTCLKNPSKQTGEPLQRPNVIVRTPTVQ